MVDTRVTLAGVTLENPVIPASGTFGYGEVFADLYDLNILGAIATKGVTREPRFGNPTPRIAEGPAGMINSVGLENPGLDRVLAEEFPRLRERFHRPILANICGFSIEEYAENSRRVSRESDVELLEINISCPNVADIAAVAKACEEAGADGVSLINTLLAMRIDLRTRRPVLANVMGGLSGPAVFPVALRMVWQVYNAVNIPIIGLGGVSSARDVVEMILAGATAVQVGAANLVDPWACQRIIEELPQVLAELGIEKLSDSIGGAHS